jgi:SOS-response transcriptional repressor LexA
MNGIGIRLKDCRARARMTQQELADRCGVSRAAVAQWELGITHPSTDHVIKAGAALNVDTGFLLGSPHSLAPNDPSLTLAGQQIPIIDLVEARDLPKAVARLPGADILIADARVNASCFAFVIADRSMAPEFQPGDRVIVDPEADPKPGDFVVAHVQGDSEAVLRKFRPRATAGAGKQDCELAPINPDWPTTYIKAESPGEIIGTVVERRRYRDPSK